MKKYCSHHKECISECKHKEQQTITTRLLPEFGKIVYVSGPMSQWGRLSYFSSMFQKYIKMYQKDYKLVFLSSSQPQELNTTDDTEKG
jgi:hypothetical protein